VLRVGRWRHKGEGRGGDVTEGGVGKWCYSRWCRSAGDEDVPGNAGNYVAEICIRVAVKTRRGVNSWRPRSAAIHQSPSPPADAVRCQSPPLSRTRFPSHAVFIMYAYSQVTISQASLSFSYVIFPSAFITCDYSYRNIFILLNYNITYFRDRDGMVARDNARVIRCREEGRLIADTEIFLFFIYRIFTYL